MKRVLSAPGHVSKASTFFEKPNGEKHTSKNRSSGHSADVCFWVSSTTGVLSIALLNQKPSTIITMSR